jgi:hypothetical protein
MNTESRCTSRRITNPEAWWVAAEAQAGRRGLSLSAYIGQLIVADQPAATRKKLPSRPPAFRPRSAATN